MYWEERKTKTPTEMETTIIDEDRETLNATHNKHAFKFGWDGMDTKISFVPKDAPSLSLPVLFSFLFFVYERLFPFLIPI